MKFRIEGKITNIETKQSSKGTTYATLRVEETFHKVDGTLQTITRFVSVFSNYLLEMDLVVNDYVSIEGNLDPKVYTNSNGEPKVDLGLVATNINVLSLDTRNFGPAPQVQAAHQMNQVLPNPNQIFQTQTVTNQYNQQSQQDNIITNPILNH